MSSADKAESGVEISQVFIRIESELLPDLMSTLGSFVLEHATRNFNATVSKHSDEVDEVLSSENGTYTIIRDKKSGISTNVITLWNLDRFIFRHYPGQNLTLRGHDTKIMRTFRRNSRDNQASFDTTPYWYETDSENTCGLRVDRIQELVDKLQTKEIVVSSIGQLSLDILKNYCEVLFPKDH